MNFKIFFLSLFSLLFLTFSAVHAQQTPQEFVIQLMEDTNELSNLAEAEREQVLLELIRRGFHIPLIGRFVLGRYWRSATPEQQAEFLNVFELAAMRSFAPMIVDIPLDTFKIIRVDFGRTNIFVFSSIEPEENEVIKINWRLVPEYSYQGYKIIDITAEGVSLIVTLRSEYKSVIRRKGGIDGLINILRKRALDKR